MMVNSDFPDLHIPQRPEVWKLEGDKSPGRMRGGPGRQGVTEIKDLACTANSFRAALWSYQGPGSGRSKGKLDQEAKEGLRGLLSCPIRILMHSFCHAPLTHNQRPKVTLKS